jgi:hypothetical protein
MNQGQSPLAKDPMMQFFEYSHLPPELQAVSSAFQTLADFIVNALPRNPERTVALRKLLEAKDCAVRARIYKEMPLPLNAAIHNPASIVVEGPVIVDSTGDTIPAPPPIDKP